MMQLLAAVFSWALTGHLDPSQRPPPPAVTPLDAGPVRRWVGPLALMLVTPPVALLAWMITVHFDGSVLAFARTITWTRFLALVPGPSVPAVRILLGWTLFQALLLKFLPGETYLGPVTPAGNQPTYKLNGVSAWLVTHLALLVGVRLGVLSPRTLWESFGSLLVTLNLVALALCVGLYAKGMRYPSTTDAVRTDHRLFDFFQGVELHPTLLGMNVKQLVNCRLSMMGWSALVLLFSAYQAELHGGLSRAMTATASLITLYLFKFFVWEAGYFTSLDIMHDRFGYYLCWGLFTWVPAVYALPALSLVQRTEDLHPILAFLFVVGGVVSIWVNYAADAQRQRVRATQGNTTVWGQRPEVLPARYTTADGVARENLLLVSGFWGLARHFHYIPELTLAYLWTAPAGFSRALPWLYAVFLTILLLDRARRDDLRCAKKYGPAWEAYCRRVPWKVLPGFW